MLKEHRIKTQGMILSEGVVGRLRDTCWGDIFALNWELLAEPWAALLDLYFPL